MRIIVVGQGKLANELLSSLNLEKERHLTRWGSRTQGEDKSIVLHAGSGRELSAVINYCAKTGSTLIELATGSEVESATSMFPVVLCPNTNILMLKFMSMIKKSGYLFHGHNVRLTESHQMHKSSVPGTAVSMAHSLGLAESDIRSIRDPRVQLTELHISEADLARHAYHQITIEDDVCSLKFESRVYGDSAYADGVAQIVELVRTHKLENRIYSVMEFIEIGWL